MNIFIFFLHLYYMMNVYRRVRQGELPEGQEKVPWGTTSAHRIYPVCIVYPVGAHSVRPRNAKSHVLILHFPFSILNYCNSVRLPN